MVNEVLLGKASPRHAVTAEHRTCIKRAVCVCLEAGVREFQEPDDAA